MAPPPSQQEGPVAMSRETQGQQTPTKYRQQPSPQRQQQQQHAPAQYQTYRPPQQEREVDNHESYDSNEETDDSDEEHADQRTPPMYSGQAHHSLAYERPISTYADRRLTTAPYTPPPGMDTVARPIPVPHSRSATHHEFNASVSVGLGSSQSSRAHHPTASNSSFGTGSYGSGSDRGSKHRPPVHDEWRATDAAVVSSSPATATTKPQRWIPPANASPPSTPSALPRQPEDWVRTLRVEHEAQKKRARLELQARILDIAKREGDAIVHGYLEKDEFDAARENARGEFTRQMDIPDVQLRDGCKAERSEEERRDREQEFARRAEEAKNRYQERKRAEERERLRRCSTLHGDSGSGRRTSSFAGAGWS